MIKISFEWDEQKNKINQQKHGISFEEAQSVFFDDYAIQFWDEDHSEGEDRFLLLGLSDQLRILIVVHYFREKDSIIRILSARKATKNESQEYIASLNELCNRKCPLPISLSRGRGTFSPFSRGRRG